MSKSNIALLRIPAFLIDFSIIMTAIVAFNKVGVFFGLLEKTFAIELLLFPCIPLAFFLYWLANINIGK